jgi:hypothetical protein
MQVPPVARPRNQPPLGPCMEAVRPKRSREGGPPAVLPRFLELRLAGQSSRPGAARLPVAFARAKAVRSPRASLRIPPQLNLAVRRRASLAKSTRRNLGHDHGASASLSTPTSATHGPLSAQARTTLAKRSQAPSRMSLAAIGIIPGALSVFAAARVGTERKPPADLLRSRRHGVGQEVVDVLR